MMLAMAFAMLLVTNAVQAWQAFASRTRRRVMSKAPATHKVAPHKDWMVTPVGAGPVTRFASCSASSA